MIPGHWLGLVLCVPFSALTLMVGWQKGHTSWEIPCSINPLRSSSGTGGEGGPEGELPYQVHLEKRPLNGCCCCCGGVRGCGRDGGSSGSGSGSGSDGGNVTHVSVINNS